MKIRRAAVVPLVWLALDGIATAATGTADVGRGVSATWDVRLQADGESLKVIDEITVRNASVPPRALPNTRPFVIELPPEAEVLAGALQTAGGQAVQVKPVPGKRKGDYYFSAPLLPGDTRFAVAWRLPYRGSALIRPGIPYPVTRLVVVLPDSMRFEPESQGLFEEKPDETWAIVRRSASLTPGRSPSFRVSGTGSLARPRVPGQQPRVGRTAPSHADRTASLQGNPTAPSHGASAIPVGTEVPVPGDRRLLLGGLALVLTAGSALMLVRRRRPFRRLSA